MQGTSVVLAIQDTTEFNFTGHHSKRGMGPLDHPNMQGLKYHSILCATGEGIPLGILHQIASWHRNYDNAHLAIAIVFRPELPNQFS
jgi:hypothetical protein